MNENQISRLMATEKQAATDPRKNWWHYRRTKSTSDRDAIWQFTNRFTEDGWVTVTTPRMDVLFRLVPKGAITRDGLTWQGFHDPAEYDKGN